MKIPKKVWICGQLFSIVYKKELKGRKEEPLLGQCDTNKCTIYLEKGMSDEKKKEVFIHECCHGICENLNLNLTESQINSFALFLIDFLRQNKIKL
jgi:hypothetical protein